MGKHRLMDGPGDRQLTDDLLQRRPDAWSALYETHFEHVWRSVARLVGPNTTDVADVVQETFLAAIRSIETYDPSRGGVRHWLTGIARHHVGDYYRRRGRDERLRPGGDLAGPVARHLARWLDGRDDLPEAGLESEEAAAVVRAVLAGLTPEYRSLLVARYCDGQSVDELAQRHGTTTVALRSKFARARRAFREEFSRQSADSQDHPEAAS